MSRKERFDALLQILAARFALFLLLHIPFIVMSVPQENGAQPKPQQQGQGQQQPWWESSFFRDVRATDFLVAVFTGALVWVGWRQVNRLRESVQTQTADMARYVSEARRAADAMEGVAVSMATQVITTTEMAQSQRTFWQRQMRAYMYLDNGAVFNVADPPATYQQGPNEPPPVGRLQFRDRGPIAQLTIRNTGHTPAHDVIHVANIIMLEFPLQNPLPALDRGALEAAITVFDLPPNGVSTKFIRLMAPLNDAQIAALRAATSAIYVFGEITYRDAFGDRHITRYRYRHNEMSGAVGITSDLTGMDQGNTSD